MRVPNRSKQLSRVLPEDQSFAKANEAIAIRPKRGTITRLSRRIYNTLLYHSQKQGVDEKVYKLPLSELIGDARFNSNNTELLKSHLRDMQSTVIEWHESAGKLQRWVSSQMLGTVTIEEQGSGTPCMISWGYPEAIKERLVKPIHYTRILLEMSAQMRSYAGAALYEIGARYLTSPSRLTMREDVIWWAAVLQGRSDITEVDYRFLKRDVIKKALAEVDALCDDFGLELIEHKRGRKIEEIQFRVIAKHQQRLEAVDEPNRNVFDLELVGRLIAVGLKQEDAQDIYATTDPGQLRNTLEMVEKRLVSQTLPKIESPAAYFKDALKKGYVGFRSKTEAIAFRGAPAASTGVSRPMSEAEKSQRIKEIWENERAGQAKALYGEMHEPEQLETRTLFEKSRLTELAGPIAKAWKKDGAQSRLASTSFYRWLAQHTWPEEPSDKALLELALKKGVIGL